MNLSKTMATLKKMGTDQNIKIYKKHGAQDPLFGVSFANLNLLKKQIKTNHPLALELWDTKNSDAKSLALMIADPNLITPQMAHEWICDTHYRTHVGQFSSLIALTNFAIEIMPKWMASKKEYVKEAGFSLMASLLKNKTPVPINVVDLSLNQIHSEIHTSPNWARYAMNNALIAIAVWVPDLEKKAIEVAKNIGKVSVDHGQTNCKTPDAVPYIEKTLAYQKSKKKS
jgi:3-methyladenine DNA glycosylase AlkD